MQRVVVRRQLARADIEQATSYYLDAAGPQVAARFVTAIEAAVARAVAHPDAGSPRYAQVLNRAGLRFGPVKAFPYLVFYRATGGRLDVWRVLHAHRDLPAWLREEE